MVPQLVLSHKTCPVNGAFSPLFGFNVAKFNSLFATSAFTCRSAVVRYTLALGVDANVTRAIEERPCAEASVIIVGSGLPWLPISVTVMPNVL